MKNLILAGILITSTLSTAINADEYNAAIKLQSYTVVHTKKLKSWYDAGVDMVVLDVRNEKYFSGIMLPDALWVPYNAPDESIEIAIPSKDTQVILYCWGPNCPMSDKMADRLLSEGYTNLYKYIDGLEDWTKKGYPIQKN